MSKIDLTSFDDNHLTDKLLSAWVELFRTSTGNFPLAVIITEEQGKKFFLHAGEIMPNYKGIPLEIQTQADKKETVLDTINGILSGMHALAAKDVSDVYRLLEQMKEKIKKG